LIKEHVSDRYTCEMDLKVYKESISFIVLLKTMRAEF
jgi:hypothetical protein